ncbi:MAG: fumarate hydratase C-terminal domain-containing protein [Syntrophobacterales bacterium]|nr:fumarate hydratase C-terminal domain-containing protein [Syntrophobacterales bacterium]
MSRDLTIPITEEQIMELHVGDAVAISGIATTGRDAAHKYLVDRLIEGKKPLPTEDQRIFDELKQIYRGGAIYHSGPILRNDAGKWSIVSSGPTTSIRDEIYEDKVIAAFGLRVIIGKGGMGPRTLAACKTHRAVYVHGIGGAGVTNARAIVEVLDVFKKEFGLPEALWKIRLDRFPGIVTMDAHGRSLHEELGKDFDERLAALLRGGSEG